MKIFGTHDDRTIQQLKNCLIPGARSVLCADGHVGYSQPIGGVVAYRDQISPSGVGYDIACGNMAVQTNIMARDVPVGEWSTIADEIQKRISFGVGRSNDEPIADHPVFDRIAHSAIPWQAKLAQQAQHQLGTVGSGNHYVDVFEDEVGCVWVGVHFGSRGIGHKTATGFMNIARGLPADTRGGDGEMDAPPLLLQADAPSGQDYVEAMQIAGEFAYAGREAVVAKVLEILGAEAEWSVHNHHNFAWREEHDGEQYWVVRKGATPAFPGQWGFVGGSMGDISVILRGVDSDVSKESLYSTIHGAGRVMSRTQAAGKMKWTKAKWNCSNYRQCSFSAPIAEFSRGGPSGPDTLPTCPQCGGKLRSQKRSVERLGGGLVDFDAERGKLRERGIILRGAGADEAPPVYRPLQSVLDAHAGTIEIMHTLQPLVVVMAGPDVEDPWKD